MLIIHFYITRMGIRHSVMKARHPSDKKKSYIYLMDVAEDNHSTDVLQCDLDSDFL